MGEYQRYNIMHQIRQFFKYFMCVSTIYILQTTIYKRCLRCTRGELESIYLTSVYITKTSGLQRNVPTHLPFHLYWDTCKLTMLCTYNARWKIVLICWLHCSGERQLRIIYLTSRIISEHSKWLNLIII